MSRSSRLPCACLLLAIPLLFSGCTLMMLSSQPREFSLRNKCPFPVLVVITYDSGIQREVRLDAGDKEGQTAQGGDPADTLKVFQGGNALYTFTLPRDRGPLTYNLTSTGVTIPEK